MQETQETKFWSLGREDPLEEDRVIHYSILAWRIPWIEEPGGLQFMGLQRVRHDWARSHTYSHTQVHAHMHVPTIPMHIHI